LQQEIFKLFRTLHKSKQQLSSSQDGDVIELAQVSDIRYGGSPKVGFIDEFKNKDGENQWPLVLIKNSFF
jgi:hypothetical protein